MFIFFPLKFMPSPISLTLAANSSVYRLNKRGEKTHPCRTPLSSVTQSVSIPPMIYLDFAF